MGFIFTFNIKNKGVHELNKKKLRLRGTDTLSREATL